MMEKLWKYLHEARKQQNYAEKYGKLLKNTENLQQETGITNYKDLIATQELVREIGRSLDFFCKLAPSVNMFCIDTPRNSFTIMCRARTQKSEESVPSKKGKK